MTYLKVTTVLAKITLGLGDRSLGEAGDVGDVLLNQENSRFLTRLEKAAGSE